jgi:hypothetical protein
MWWLPSIINAVLRDAKSNATSDAKPDAKADAEPNPEADVEPDAEPNPESDADGCSVRNIRFGLVCVQRHARNHRHS